MTEWISVKTPPKECKDYLVWGTLGWGTKGDYRACIGSWSEDANGDFDFTPTDSMEFLEVLYWAEFTEPPEEEE